tara:strand:- start:235 stop:489 length:255 start_codon:yes stop_codon:yes gene_type:complete
LPCFRNQLKELLVQFHQMLANWSIIRQSQMILNPFNLYLYSKFCSKTNESANFCLHLKILKSLREADIFFVFWQIPVEKTRIEN